MAGTPSVITQVERIHAVAGLVAVLGAFVLGSTALGAGVLAGVAIGAVNFWLLGLVTLRLTTGDTRSRLAAVGWFVLKLAVLGVGIGLVVRLLAPNALALLGGLSLAPLCLVVTLSWNRRRPPASPAPADAPPPGMEAS